MRTFKVVGVMSGTSMDGLDIAHCDLTLKEDGRWDYEINKAITVSYNETWRVRLSKLRNQSALVFYKTDRYFGQYIGQIINDFLEENDLSADLISSHGHTIFHQPEKNISVQVGNGQAITAVTGIPAVTDFRYQDVVKNGEGAPVSGIGDELLFKEFDMCLNLGGFANISTSVNGVRLAYDICPVNILLNRMAREFGQEYDQDGKIAESGRIDYDLLSLLNDIEFYSIEPPKSLGREWINKNLWYHVRESRISKEDKMKTLVDHMAEQIGNNIEKLSDGDASLKRVFVTGGGAFNNTLIDHLRTHTDAEIIIPDENIVKFKEALIFALMGLLRVNNKENIWSSMTGADSDSIGGHLAGDFTGLINAQ